MMYEYWLTSPMAEMILLVVANRDGESVAHTVCVACF